MKLSCAQMDVLISFYIEGDLSNALKKQVEEHIKKCPTCKAKFDIIKSMITDLKSSLNLESSSFNQSEKFSTNVTSKQYGLFKTDLSAYIDNELTDEENIKIKKFTINNAQARQDLEESYKLRKIMKESFNKIKNDAKQDFSKNIIRQLELEEEATAGIHPVIKILIAFTLIVLIITSLVLMSLAV